MNQIKAGVILNYVSICLHMVVGLIYTPFMLRTLGQSEYGLYSLATSIIAYLTVLDLGFGNSIIRYTAKFRAENKMQEQEEMFGMFFVLYIGIGLIAMGVGGFMALNADKLFATQMDDLELHRMRIMLWLMTFNLAFTFPMSLWGAIMSAYERFVFQKMVSIVRSIVNPVVMVLFLVVGYKAVAMVVVTTLFNVVTLLVNLWYCKHYLHIRLRYTRFRWTFLKEVSAYSFWIFLNVIMDRIYWSTGQFILGIYKGTIAIAVYSVAIQLQQMYMMFSTAISGLLLPKVTSMVVKGNDKKTISDLFIKTGRIQYIIMAFILTSFIVFGQSFIHLWAGKGYEDSYIIALLFFIPLTVPLIQNIGITILQARNQMRFRSVLYIAIALGCFGLSIPLAKFYGGIGCAISTSFALTVGQIVAMNIYYQRRQGLDIIHFWFEIGKMSLVPVFMILVSFTVIHSCSIELENVTVFVISAILFTVVYLSLFWKFSMNKEEQNLCFSLVSHFLKKYV